MTKWISVDVRLPDDDDLFLVVGPGGHMAIALYMADAEDFNTSFGVTHWAELPEPPCGECD